MAAFTASARESVSRLLRFGVEHGRTSAFALAASLGGTHAAANPPPTQDAADEECVDWIVERVPVAKHLALAGAALEEANKYEPSFVGAPPAVGGAGAGGQHVAARNALLAFGHRIRVDKVTAALAAVDKKAADFRKGLPPKPIAEGLLHYVKKQAWEK